MKKFALLLVIAVAAMGACKEDAEDAAGERITEDRISNTWLAVRETRASDNWMQLDEKGIMTNWTIDDPFGGTMQINAIKFGRDRSFLWNITTNDEWEYVHQNLPQEFLSTYRLTDDGKSVTLYTRFNYVGIVKTDTTAFQISIDEDNRLILTNEEVELEFLNTFQY